MALIEMEINSLRQDLLHYEWVITLKEKSSENYLPVCIGSEQGNILKSLLENTGPEYVIEQDKIALNIEDIEGVPRAVMIESIKNGVFNAGVIINRQKESSKVDCSLAEVLFLSVTRRLPILVEEALLTRHGISIRA